MKTNQFIIAYKGEKCTHYISKDGILTRMRNLSKIFQTYKSACDYAVHELWYIDLKKISIYRY